MSTTQKDVDRLRNTPCPKLSMTGLDGSVIHRKTWLEYILDDHGCIKKLSRCETEQWGEANLCPMDFVRLIWLELKPFSYPAFITSDAAFGLERLAHRWHTDPSRVFAKLVDEWVAKMEPDGWWAADYSSGLSLPEEIDYRVALIPPLVMGNHSSHFLVCGFVSHSAVSCPLCSHRPVSSQLTISGQSGNLCVAA